jgi:hypothetical protein
MSNFPFAPEKTGNFCLECCPDPINTSVDSRGGWQSTGWIVEPNQKLKITASGTVYWMGSSYTSGPDGIYHPYCSDLNFLHEAILGRVGNNGTVFLVGSSYLGIPGEVGELSLFTNDYCKGDNGGSFQVRIECD